MATGAGAALVVAPREVYAGAALTTLMHDNRVSAALLTPTVVASLDRPRLDGLTTLVTGGEACPDELVHAWAPGRRMHNAYGPSEATIWATGTTADARRSRSTSARRSPAMRTLVLDAQLNPVPSAWWGSCIWPGPHWRTATWAGCG